MGGCIRADKRKKPEHMCMKCKVKRSAPSSSICSDCRRAPPKKSNYKEKTTPWTCSACGLKNPGGGKASNKCGNQVNFWDVGPNTGCGKRRTTERRRLNRTPFAGTAALTQPKEDDSMTPSERFLHRRRLACPQRDSPVLLQVMDKIEHINASSPQN